MTMKAIDDLVRALWRVNRPEQPFPFPHSESRLDGGNDQAVDSAEKVRGVPTVPGVPGDAGQCGDDPTGEIAERAAILEYEAGHDRREAERVARSQALDAQ